MIGQTIFHYRVVEELGRGGMGVVYKAEDLTLKRTVALKFLSPQLLSDDQSSRRFLREAQAAAALDHPNITTVHEIAESEGHTFIVMAYVEGEDLDAKMEKGPMAIGEALDIAIQVGRGLSKAHEAGIVHRDVKPGNVRLTPGGGAKVLDFGLAKLSSQSKLTRSGTSVGTARYMSPEQATGEEVDQRTDVWSLGVMLYEMLAGWPPFAGEAEPATIYSILHEDPEPITSARKEVPVGIEDVLEKALEKDVQKRYPTMGAFLMELERERDHLTLGINRREYRTLRILKRRRRLLVGISAVLVLLVVATFVTCARARAQKDCLCRSSVRARPVGSEQGMRHRAGIHEDRVPGDVVETLEQGRQLKEHLAPAD